MKVAIHQPNCFPWMGYFSKMSKSDVFVFLDDVEYSKGSFTSRVKIHQNKDEQWFTIPVKKHRSNALINEIQLDRSKNFELQLIKKVKQEYHHATFLKELIELLEKLFFTLKDIDSLAIYNRKVIEEFASIMQITPEFISSSELNLRYNKDQVVLTICEALQAENYISGLGGKKYLKEEAFAQKGIQLHYSDFNITDTHLKQPIFESYQFKSIISWIAQGYRLKDLKVKH